MVTGQRVMAEHLRGGSGVNVEVSKGGKVFKKRCEVEISTTIPPIIMVQ